MRSCILLALLCSFSVHAAEAERVFETVHDSVVTITTLDERGQPDAEGSGIVIGKEQVITNCHVVLEAVSISVRQEGRSLPAELKLKDVQRDLCRLDVPGLKASPVKTRGFKDIQVGEQVFAVGNPLGLGLSVSSGLVASLGRQGGGQRILTSAPVSPGSSGGGLFDAEGRLIGITTMILSTAQNMNVALPSDWIAELSARGETVSRAPTVVAADPDWGALAETLRIEQKWDKLAELSIRWRQAYPTSSSAAAAEGLAYFNLQRYAESNDVLRKALQYDPNNATAHAYLAQALYLQGEKQQALERIHKAITILPASPYPWWLLALIQHGDNSLDEAASSLQNVLRFNPADENSWMLLADIQYRQQKLKEATESLRAALRLKPGDSNATSNLAMILARLGEGNSARQMLNTPTVNRDNDAHTWYFLGGEEEKKKHFAEAESAYRKALEMKPDYPEAWLALTFYLQRSNRLTEAEKALREALRLKPDFAQAWFRLGNLLNERGDKEEAKNAYLKAVASDPALAAAWYSAGIIQRDLHDMQGALKSLEKAAKLDTANSALLAYLGDTRLRLGQREEAFKTLSQAEKIDPKNDIALQGLSSYYAAMGNLSKSLDYVDRALEINAASPFSWSNKGYTLMKMGRYPEAIKSLETAVRLQPDFANPWINLGETCLRSKQIGKAISALLRAVELAPTAMDARLFLAQAYFDSTQFAKTKEILDVLLPQHPNYAPAWGLLAAADMSMGNKQGTLTAYNKLKSLNPGMARSFRVQSRAQGMPFGYELPE